MKENTIAGQEIRTLTNWVDDNKGGVYPVTKRYYVKQIGWDEEILIPIYDEVCKKDDIEETKDEQ